MWEEGGVWLSVLFMTRQTGHYSESGDGFCDEKCGCKQLLTKLTTYPKGLGYSMYTEKEAEKVGKQEDQGFHRPNSTSLSRKKSDFVYLSKEVSIISLGLCTDQKCLGNA